LKQAFSLSNAQPQPKSHVRYAHLTQTKHTLQSGQKITFTDPFHLSQQNTSPPNSITTPAPLNPTPSRARNKFTERLAARAAKQQAEETSTLHGTDPDSVDAAAVQQAFEMPAQPLSDLPDLDLSAVTERQINELIGNTDAGGAGQGDTRVVSAYSSSSSSSTSSLDSGSDDEEPSISHPQDAEEANPVVGIKRRPSTTEAKKRVPLDDGDEDAAEGQGQGQRPQVTRMVSDPFESPVESSEDSSEDSGEELSFGR
jgi:SIT4-associating protein SAP185/190